MSRNRPSPDNARRRPQTVAEVLCNEVGASHPDGALKQIRTMKRLLRSHYQAQKKLQRYGVDGLGDAVTRIAQLQGEVTSLKKAQRRRAAANVAAIDEALDILEDGRERLRRQARDGADASAAVADDVQAAREVIGAVERELSELRLELWLKRGPDDGSPPSAASEAGLTQRRDAPRPRPADGESRRERPSTNPDEAASLLQRLSERLDALSDSA